MIQLQTPRWIFNIFNVFFMVFLMTIPWGMAIPPWVLAGSGPMDVRDKDITIAIKSRFLVDHTVPGKAIDVQTERGVVRLTGVVPSLLARERAGKIVASIRGVEALINTIQVKPLKQIDNESLQLRVLAALAADPAADSYELTVDVDDGRVTLSGSVDSWQEKQLSEEVVKGVKGVQALNSLITLKPAASRPDSEIEAEIIRRLQSDVWVHEKLIGIMVRQGHVTLTGTVGSLAEKNTALTDAWVSGVTGVNGDRLKVEWWARDRMLRNPAEMFSSNTRTEEAVQTALRYDPRLQNVEINVRLVDGTAILTGFVQDAAAKIAAEETTKNTIGIWQVRNFLKVSPLLRLSDEELEQRVRETFNEHALIDRYGIKISAKDGRIRLEGYLDSSGDISLAIRTAARVKGVKDIVNDLAIESQGKPDENIWREIRRSFWWDPGLYNQDITVTVDDGIVTLQGTVPSIQEWRTAMKIAQESGAEKVRNSLRVAIGLDAESGA